MTIEPKGDQNIRLRQDDVALVTGAGRGIGRQVAIDFAAAGAAVALLARSDGELRNVASEIEAAGGRALVLKVDVTDTVALTAAVEEAARQLGPITIAVNNAGSDRPYGPVDVATPADWWQAQSLHVLAPYTIMHAIIPMMRQLGRGRIINVSSAAAKVIGVNTSSYCVGKATLVRLTEHVDQELGTDGPRAFVVDPGLVMTAMGNAAIDDPEARKWAGGLVDHLATYRSVDPEPALRHLGRQFLVLACGQYDGLSGGLIELQGNFDEQLAARQANA